VVGGGYVDAQPALRVFFDYDGPMLALLIIAYGFAAAMLPVWLLLAPRDYLMILQPEVKMPAVTQFVDGTGPIFGGKLFPFVFITVACGAVSGFHALVASDTTPKLLTNESDARFIGYGAMMMESFVAIMAMVAATVLEPGVYFAINSPAGIVGTDPAAAVAAISGWGFPVSLADMHAGAGGKYGRSEPVRAHQGGALARGGDGEHLRRHLRRWAHGALVPLRDHVRGPLYLGHARCRHPRRALHAPGPARKSGARARPHRLVSGGDPDERAGGRRLGVFPVHGDHRSARRHQQPVAAVRIANQMLAAIALCVATTILVKSGKLRYAWITALPLSWLVTVTSTAAMEKLLSPEPRVGCLAHAQELGAQLAGGSIPADKAAQLIFNDRLDALLIVLFLAATWVLVLETLRVCLAIVTGHSHPPLTETPRLPNRLAPEWGRED
jgi:carbon starvation protein